MSVEKATAFLKVLAQDKSLQEKMAGFTLDELNEAAKAGVKLSDDDLENVAGGITVLSTIIKA